MKLKTWQQYSREVKIALTKKELEIDKESTMDTGFTTIKPMKWKHLVRLTSSVTQNMFKLEVAHDRKQELHIRGSALKLMNSIISSRIQGPSMKVVTTGRKSLRSSSSLSTCVNHMTITISDVTKKVKAALNVIKFEISLRIMLEWTWASQTISDL